MFNLLAEDVEWAERLAGSDLTDLMHANAALLEEYYTRKGVVVVNNLDAVPDSLFRDRDWTTEHYLQQGRQIIADKVAEQFVEAVEAVTEAAEEAAGEAKE